MLTHKILLLIISGGVLLYFSGDYLVKGGSHLARQFGISPLVIGLTIVAFGTSLPEMVVSLVAALKGSESIAVGNVIGSNIANIGLIIGISATMFHIVIGKHKFLRDLNILLIVSLIFAFMAWDGILKRWEGIILVIGIVSYTSYCIYSCKGNRLNNNDTGSLYINVLFIVAGIIGLSIGAKLFVDGSTLLARSLGVSEFVIGVTIAAYGTSLPELATSLVAAYRKESEISIGNIIGSNLFNIMAVMGLVSTVSPLSFDSQIFSFEIPIMFVYTLALYPIVKMQGEISRIYALILLTGYIVFVTFLFIR